METGAGTSEVSSSDRRGLGRGPTIVDLEHSGRTFSPEQSAGLFVGVSQFVDPYGEPSGEIHTIDFAVDDAIDLAELFALRLHLIKPASVRLALSGAPKKGASAEALRQLTDAGAKRFEARFITVLDLLDEVQRLARADGLLVTSFATHGFSVGGRDHLLCQDSLLSQPQLTSLCVQDLLSKMQEAEASSTARRLILIDACREFLRKSRGLKSESVSDSFIKAIEQARGTVVLTGTVAGGFSYDDPKSQNGVFTSSVRSGLLGAAGCDERGFVTPQTLSEYLQQQVERWVAENRRADSGQSTGISQVIDGACARMPLAVNGEKWEAWRRREEMQSKPTPEQIREGLDALTVELTLRAPVLLERGFDALRKRLTDPAVTTAPKTQDSDEALARIDTICQTALNLSFASFAHGARPAAYQGRDTFPGGRAFLAEEKDFFFGREAILVELKEELAQHRMVAIVGRSGSGKTSLVQAGLVPMLRVAAPDLEYLRITPGQAPLANLNAALAARASTGPLLLFVDQFEQVDQFEPVGQVGQAGHQGEALPPSGDAAGQLAPFFDRLLSLTREGTQTDQPVQVVLAMRADFIKRYATRKNLPPLDGLLLHRRELGALEGEELQRVIAQQLACGHLLLDPPALGRRIAREVKDQRCRMALVQLALDELHKRRYGDRLVEKEYDEMGGIEGAMAQSAEAMFMECTPEEQELVQEIFTRLVRIEEEDSSIHDVYGDLDEAAFLRYPGEDPKRRESLRKLVRRLDTLRLIVVEEGRIQLTHEKLIDSWDRLGAWRIDGRPFLLQRQGIENAALAWERGGQKELALRHRDEDLEALVPLRRSPRLARIELDYLDRCFRLRDRERSSAVDQRLKDLSQMGWGVIFPFVEPDSDEARRQEVIIQSLRPLLDLRREQVRDPTYYREFTGASGYLKGELKYAFLSRHGARTGPVRPGKVPYYLLIVGDPERIPFEFQYQLQIDYAVGRLHFDAIEDYAAYARSIVTAEQGQVSRRARRAVLFGSHNSEEQATAATVQLLESLFERLTRYQSDWQMETVLREEATKARLSALLLDAPAFLFAACHGMEFAAGAERQAAGQGALLCQEVAGAEAAGPSLPDSAFSGEDLTPAHTLLGFIAFLWGSCTAGTPRMDGYTFAGHGGPPQMAPAAFVSRLAQRLLGKRDGGAAAVIGHVDRVWGHLFMTPGAHINEDVYVSTIIRLLEGYPVGAALDFFNQRYAELTVDVAAILEAEQKNAADPLELARMRTAARDARNYIILGDPAARIA